MNDEHDFVEQRLSRVESVLRTIERSRRRWRNCTIAVVALVLAYGLLGAKEKPADAEFETLTAKELRVVDQDNTPIFSVTSDNHGLSTLSLSSSRTGAFVCLATKSDFASVSTDAAGGLHRAEMFSTKTQNRVHLQMKMADTVRLDGTRGVGSIELSKTADGIKSERRWGAP